MRVAEPFRVTRTYIQKLQAGPEEVFPLLCPVREAEWVDGWDPLVVYSRSGLAEPDCVFVTGNKEPDSAWIVTKRDTESFDLEIIKVTPWTTIARINISLRPNEQSGTDAEVTYSYTALSEAGEAFVNNYTEEYYAAFMGY
ncbi:MAG TPA: hypothetical protein PKV86_11820, partial [Syntrophobacteraceae bacterium]|nr:hypothetical protein [Syntrophobacteraceae bacterium]